MYTYIDNTASIKSSKQRDVQSQSEGNIMQTSKFKPVFCLVAINKNFVRNVAVKSASSEEVIKAVDDTQLKSWQEIPGPSSLPIIGQLHHFLPGGDLSNLSASEFGEKMYQTYGPITKLTTFGSPPVIFLGDPESSAQILRGDNWFPIRTGFDTLDYYRTKYKKSKAPEYSGLLTDQGEKWKNFRSKVNPALLQPKTIKLYRTVLEEVAQDMINRIRSIRGENNMIKTDFDVEMNLWALESIGVVALGDRLNCFDPNLPEDSPARRLIKVVHEVFILAEELDFKPSLWRLISTPKFKRAMKVYEEQENLAKYFVGKAIEKYNTKTVNSDEEKGVLEKLLEIDENIAHIMASDMLFAGVDTTSNTITASLYLLAINPEKQEKLRDELNSEQKSRYLRACIKESLRILPVVSANARQTTKEYNILGYRIPKDMLVVFQHEMMSKMENQYPRPLEYLPERWLVDKEDPLYYGNAHPFAHNPFGFGVRACIGRRIAELEVETFLAKMIQNFKVEWFGPPLKIKKTSLNYTAPPFNFVLKDI
ncbi:cytochrome P450 CYP12A2-like [Achroia grisella]|uniref:cytochrome P450 CYP12A2-like n=1 Tax=Achroia grisella TaxID=688607 RepID=UPI0027D29952|nr:cytochrome P450 CYP12A2-like [Achroia grisella]